MMTENEMIRIKLLDEFRFICKLEEVIDESIREAVEETEPSLKNRIYAKVWND